VKICVVSSSIFPASPENYGSEVMAAILADELGKKHDVTLFATPRSMKGRYDLKLIPLTYGKVSYWAERLVYEDPDYRQILLDSDFVIDMSATNYTSEALYFWERDRLYKDIVPVYFRNGTAFGSPRYPANMFLHGVALSKFAREVAIGQWGIPEEKMHYVYYGIDTDVYSFCKDKEDYILYIGRPHWHKGVHRILMLAKKLPNEKFVLAWRASTEEHKRFEKFFKHIVKWKGLKNVIFYELPEGNQLKEKVRLYQKAKAFITPHDKKYAEAFGLTLAEAMSCGTPVITSRHGSAPEVVEHGVTGFCCEELDEYVEAIKRIDEIGPRVCRKRVEEKFSKEVMAENYLKLYEEVVS